MIIQNEHKLCRAFDQLLKSETPDTVVPYSLVFVTDRHLEIAFMLSSFCTEREQEEMVKSYIFPPHCMLAQ